MPEKKFVIWLSNVDYLVVFFRTERGKTVAYTVKYLTVIDGQEYEIARFDSGHENCHMDVLLPDGGKERVIEFPVVPLNDAVDFAVENFRLNFDTYRERFTRWLKREK